MRRRRGAAVRCTTSIDTPTPRRPRTIRSDDWAMPPRLGGWFSVTHNRRSGDVGSAVEVVGAVIAEAPVRPLAALRGDREGLAVEVVEPAPPGVVAGARRDLPVEAAAIADRPHRIVGIADVPARRRVALGAHRAGITREAQDVAGGPRGVGPWGSHAGGSV